MKSIILLLFPFALQAQVAKPVVVEHFTNSRCSVCASQNPAFYDVLATHPEVKHIAYYPTSPYVNCQLAQHNPTESDARTNYYGLYGSTPKIAIQGTPLSNSPNPFPNPNLYDAYQGQTSAFDMKVIQSKDADTIRLKVVLKTIAAHSFTELRLYAAAAEDTVFYNSPNGESIHHDVFRKSFFGATGMLISPAATIGDSVVYESKMGKHPAWNFNRIFGYAIVQNATSRALVQSDFALPSANVVTGNRPSVSAVSDFQLFPNPSTKGFSLKFPQSTSGQIRIVSTSGKMVYSTLFSGSEFTLENSIPSGLYLIEVQTGKSRRSIKWVKE